MKKEIEIYVATKTEDFGDGVTATSTAFGDKAEAIAAMHEEAEEAITSCKERADFKEERLRIEKEDMKCEVFYNTIPYVFVSIEISTQKIIANV